MDTTPGFAPLLPAELCAVLDDPRTLLVDIRPHAAHAHARLPRALSLAVPSTLLRRPLCSLERLAQMLRSSAARLRFLAFNDSARIVVYDADSSVITENIHGLLRKFRSAHFAGELAWLRGGFQAVCREQPHLVDTQPQEHHSAHSVNPFFDAVRQNTELSHGFTERIPLCLPARVRRRIADLPFPWLREIAKRADRPPPSEDPDPSPTPADVHQGTETLASQFYRIELAEQQRLMRVMQHHSNESRHPPSVAKSFPFSITAGVEKGSKNRYRHIWPFEHARVKLCHSAREGKELELDDYVNASFVQPLGTTKKYIATQGPLEETFEDFWRLIWQQNVHVIVMLTQEVENSMVKCGTYWPDATPAMRERIFGVLRVTLVAKVALPGDLDLVHEDPPGPVTTIKRTFRLEHRGYPNVGPREVVQLQYLEWPDMNVPEDARGVLGLVKEVEVAVRETEEHAESLVEGRLQSFDEVDPLSGVARHVMGTRRPVLLHCSAGVGRTGCFIALDAVLDGIRREVRERGVVATRQEAMDVDLPIVASGQPSPVPRSTSAAHVVMPSSHDCQMDDTAIAEGAALLSSRDSSGASHSRKHGPAFTSLSDTTDRDGTSIPVGQDRLGDGQSGFMTASAPQTQTLHGKSKPHFSFGSGAGPSSLGRSSSTGDAPPQLVRPREPRVLHAFLQTPVALSTFEEPIWEVVQDMREQRMSLCQSLRQYVFMHQVVIEGALRIVDEEREREEGMIRQREGEGSGNAKFVVPLFGAAVDEKDTFPLSGLHVRSQSTPRQLFPPPPLSDAQRLNSPGRLSSDSASSTMKRGASPTELLKEGKKGEPLLSKRPSIKRNSRELKEGGDSAVREPTLPSSSSSPIPLQSR